MHSQTNLFLPTYLAFFYFYSEQPLPVQNGYEFPALSTKKLELLQDMPKSVFSSFNELIFKSNLLESRYFDKVKCKRHGTNLHGSKNIFNISIW